MLGELLPGRWRTCHELDRGEKCVRGAGSACIPVQPTAARRGANMKRWTVFLNPPAVALA
jgi:hypothetical protein